MNLAILNLFADVMRLGSFAAAAKYQQINPSQVSRAIAGLEQELGVRLFQRSTRKNSPTEAGQHYFSKIEPLLDELAQAAAHITDEALTPAGHLRITASIAFSQMCIVPFLSEFCTLYPRISIDLITTDANLDLIAERIDIAIRLGPRLDVGYIGARLFPTVYRVCASPDYLARVGPFTLPNQLTQTPCLLLDLPLYRDRWLFQDNNGSVTDIPVKGQILVSSPLTLRSCCLSGIGPALLADWLVAKDLANGRLIDLFPAYRVTATDFETAAWILYPSRAYLPLKARHFIDFYRERLASRNSKVA